MRLKQEWLAARRPPQAMLEIHERGELAERKNICLHGV